MAKKQYCQKSAQLGHRLYGGTCCCSISKLKIASKNLGQVLKLDDKKVIKINYKNIIHQITAVLGVSKQLK